MPVIPPVPPALLAYVQAGDADRDAWMQSHRHQLVECFHRLLLAAVSERTEQPDADFGASAAELLGDFLRRSDHVLPDAPLADDAAAVMALDGDVLRERARLRQDAERTWRRLRSTRSEPAAGADQAIAAAAVDAIVPALDRFARAHRDRDLERYAALLALARARDESQRLARDDPSQAPAARSLDAALLRVAALLREHGLEGDERYLLAVIERAYLLLQRDATASDAAEAVEDARRVVESRSFPPDLAARVASLQVQVFAARGLDHAADDAASRLERLLPALREQAHEQPRSVLGALVAEWSRQAAVRHARHGRHAEALALLLDARGLPAIEPGQRLRIGGSIAIEHLAAGAFTHALEEAAAVLKRVDGVPPYAADAHLMAPLALQMEIVRAESAARLGLVEVAEEALANAELRRQDAPGLPADLRARCDLVLGLVRSATGDLEPAIAAYGRVLEALPPAAPTVETVQALSGLSRLHLLLGDAAVALNHALQAVDAARRVTFDHEALVGTAELLAGEALLADDRPAAALERIERALSHVPAGGTRLALLEMRGLRLQGAARWELWQPSGRRETDLATIIGDLERATAMPADGARPMGPEPLAEALRAFELLLEIRLASEDRPGARRAMEGADRLVRAACGASADATPAPLGWGECRAVLDLIHGRWHESAGERDLAVARYRSAIALEDVLRRGLRFRAPPGLSRRFESIHDRIAGLLLEEAAAAADPGRAREALSFLEDVRARSLRSLIASAEARLREQWSKASGGPPWPRRIKAPPPFEARTLDGLLAPGRAVLVYAATPRGTFVIGLREGQTEVARCDLETAAIERSVAALGQALEGNPDAHKRTVVLQEAVRLYRSLVLPVAEVVAGARDLVIVPDGPLHGLPFAALIEPAAGGAVPADLGAARFLASKDGLESITYAPSLATLSSLEARPAAVAEADLLLVGCPGPAGGTGPGSLSQVAAELAAIRASFAGGRVTAIEGEQATWAALKAADPGRFATLHFATHAERSPLSGEIARLVLGGSETVGAPEIAELSLRATRLVVLAACRSGSGRVAGVEGLLSLPRAFLVAGARTVVAALVDVHDGASARLMAALYHGIASGGAGPAASLLAAQRSLLADAATRWPGFWAPFFAYGLR